MKVKESREATCGFWRIIPKQEVERQSSILDPQSSAFSLAEAIIVGLRLGILVVISNWGFWDSRGIKS